MSVETGEDATVPESSKSPRLPPLSHYALATAVIIGVITLALLVYQARGILVVVFGGFLIAAGLDPIIVRLEKLGLRRGFAVAVLFFGAVLLLGGFITLALVPAIRQTTEFINQVPEIIDQISGRVSNPNDPIGKFLNDPDVQEQAKKIAGEIPAFAASSAGFLFGAVQATFSGVFFALTISVLTIYFMMALPKMRARFPQLLGNQERADVLNEALRKIGGYVTGQLTVCACGGVAAYIFFLIAGVPYSALLAITVAFTALIPQVGTILGALIGTLVALTESLPLAIGTLIFFLVYQQIENYAIAPRIFASAIELTPLSAFLSVLIGGAVGGAFGAIAGLPIAAASKVVFKYLFGNRLVGGSTVDEPPPPTAEPVSEGGKA